MTSKTSLEATPDQASSRRNRGKTVRRSLVEASAAQDAALLVRELRTSQTQQELAVLVVVEFTGELRERKQLTAAARHRLFAAVRISEKSDACKLDAATLRTFLVFLYATGALMSEGLRLQRKDVDLRRKHIAIRSVRANRSRDIPIGEDLCRVLKIYQDAKHRKNPDKDLPFFATVEGHPVNKVTIAKSFQRARTVSGITRTDGSQYQPRLHDLRHTFAVHRMTSWFRHGADMNRMIPALAAYLGQMELESTERYLKNDS